MHSGSDVGGQIPGAIIDCRRDRCNNLAGSMHSSLISIRLYLKSEKEEYTI